MNYLLRSVTVIDPNSSYHLQTVDIVIEHGRITRIGNDLEAANEVIIEGSGNYVSPGWFDLRSSFNDPGYEHKEDLDSGCNAAAAGGFTGVAVLPHTQPIVQSKAMVEYIINKNLSHLVEVYPIGALTQKLEGNEITEMYDMHLSGAVAFSDGNRPVKHAGLMQRALLYAKGFEGLVMVHAEEESLSHHGQVHEGILGTSLGFKGMPSLSEYLLVQRDIGLAEYLDTRIHFSHISCRESVDLIRQAKAKGLKVTCDVAAHQLLFTDEALVEFDSNFKVNPPLRTEDDRLALLDGIADGTIDAIISDHNPQDIESKVLEFDYAEFGISGLQTAFPMALQASRDKLELEQLIHALSQGPRTVLGLRQPQINEGQFANLTVFNTEQSWVLNEKSNKSLSQNNPLWGQELTGRVIAVFNKNQAAIFQS